MNEATIDIGGEVATQPVDAAGNDATEALSTPPVEPAEAIEAAEPSEDGGEIDYEQLMKDDLKALKASFPELEGVSALTEIEGVIRYAALRDMGLSATEAYMATRKPAKRQNNRAHLTAAVARSASAPTGSMTRDELYSARELFSGMSDAEIQSLYKRVTR